LLDALIAEFLGSAKLAAVVTSMVTARRAGRKLQYIGSIEAYAPADPLIFPAVGAGLSGPIPYPALFHSLHEYYMRQAFVSALSRLPPDAWNCGDKPSIAEWTELEDAWCCVCSTATIVMHHIPEVRSMDDPAAQYRLASLHRLVNAAKMSESPCVRSDGTVFVPGWLDRRRQERRTVGCKVWLETGGVRERATLHDISMGGMGLAFCKTFPVGTEVAAQLPNGRRLVGNVAWSHEDRMGATFARPLSPTDPLLFPDYSEIVAACRNATQKMGE
jgi:hypothetical protein